MYKLTFKLPVLSWMSKDLWSSEVLAMNSSFTSIDKRVKQSVVNVTDGQRLEGKTCANSPLYTLSTNLQQIFFSVGRLNITYFFVFKIWLLPELPLIVILLEMRIPFSLKTYFLVVAVVVLFDYRKFRAFIIDTQDPTLLFVTKFYLHFLCIALVDRYYFPIKLLRKIIFV